MFKFEKSGIKVVSAFGSIYTYETFFFFSKLKFTKHTSCIKNLQHQLRCENACIDINLQQLSERIEKQIFH